MAKHNVVSSVTGVVFELAVKAGDPVAPGDTIAIVESMKMELPIVAACAGRVVELLVEVEQPVDEGQTIAVIQS